MKMRQCVSCGRRRPLKKMTEVGSGGQWRCTYWQGRCLNLQMPTRWCWRALGMKWEHRQRRDVHVVGA